MSRDSFFSTGVDGHLAKGRARGARTPEFSKDARNLHAMSNLLNFNIGNTILKYVYQHFAG